MRSGFYIHCADEELKPQNKLEKNICIFEFLFTLNTLIFLDDSQHRKFSLSPHFLGFDKQNRTELNIDTWM